MLSVIFGFKSDIQFEKLCEKWNINQQKIAMRKMKSLEMTLTMTQLARYSMFHPTSLCLIRASLVMPIVASLKYGYKLVLNIMVKKTSVALTCN
jgi:hypothetical protein